MINPNLSEERIGLHEGQYGYTPSHGSWPEGVSRLHSRYQHWGSNHRDTPLSAETVKWYASHHPMQHQMCDLKYSCVGKDRPPRGIRRPSVMVISCISVAAVLEAVHAPASRLTSPEGTQRNDEL